MTKKDYLKQLEYALRGCDRQEVDDILRDQEEMINEAVRRGRSEAEFINSLGSPQKYASSIVAEAKVAKAESAASVQSQFSGTLSALLAMIALFPLNFLILVGPFLVVSTVVLTLWAVEISLGVALAGGWAAFTVQSFLVSVNPWILLSGVFTLLCLSGALLLSGFIIAACTRLFLSYTIKYLKWNLSFIKTSYSMETQS